MWMKGEGYTARAKFPSAAPRFTHKKKVPTTWIFTDQKTEYLNIYKSTAYELSPEKKV